MEMMETIEQIRERATLEAERLYPLPTKAMKRLVPDTEVRQPMRQQAYVEGVIAEATREKDPWIKVEDRLPTCDEWDSEREAFFGTPVITWSPIHRFKIVYPREDNVLWPQPRTAMTIVRQRGNSFKWGITGHDPSITHWQPLPSPPTTDGE